MHLEQMWEIDEIYMQLLRLLVKERYRNSNFD